MRLYVGKITVETRRATLHIAPDSSNVTAFWLCIPWPSDKLTLDLSLGHHIVLQEYQDYILVMNSGKSMLIYEDVLRKKRSRPIL